MNTPEFIKKIIKNHKEKEFNKPKYELKNLYIAKIVLLRERRFTSLTWASYYHEIKQFAILYKKSDYSYDTYVHVKSGQKLAHNDDILKTKEGDCAVIDVIPFTKYFAVEMLKNSLTKNSKISKHAVELLETEANKKLAPEQQPTKLFGL